MIHPNLTDGPRLYGLLVDAVYCYKLLLWLNAALCSLLFLLILHLVRHRSPPGMGPSESKLILNSNLTCWLIALLQAVYVPIPIHPIGSIGFGFFRYWNSTWSLVCFCAWVALITNLAANYMFAFNHYYALMKPIPSSLLCDTFRTGSIRCCYLYATFYLLMTFFLTSGTLALMLSPQEMAQKLDQYPSNHFFRVLFANEPSLILLRNFFATKWSIILNGLHHCMVLFMVTVMICANVGILREIRRTHKIVQLRTHYLQLSAYFHLFLIKTVLMLAFLFLPFLINVIAISGLVFISPLWQMRCYLCFAIHSLAIMLHTIFYIPAYRQWVYNKICCLCISRNDEGPSDV